MALTKEEKDEIIGKFAVSKTDTGSPEVQVSLLTARINRLSEHFQKHKKDLSSKRGFLKLVKARQRLLAYLTREDPKRYEEIIKKLGIRK